MAAGGIGEIAVITTFINKATAFASVIASNWYKGSKELEEFPDKITTLRVKHHFWKTQLKRYGMSADQLVAPLVLSATKRLEQEEQRLKRCYDSGVCTRCWRKMNYMVFPGQLTASVQAVIDGFDNIPLMLKGSKEHITQLEQTKSDKPLKLPFGPDRRYVPLVSTNMRIKAALEARVPEGSRVVLLHGAPGTGKSNLARFIALHYQERMFLHDRRRRVLHQNSVLKHSGHFHVSSKAGSQSSTGAADENNVIDMKPEFLNEYDESSEEISIGNLFKDGVFYLYCGERAEVIAKQLELLQGLGFNCSKGADAGKEVTTTSSEVIRKNLLLHLEEQSVLIVLDDVWDSSIIQGLLTPGKRVRYLVTSQNARLWEDAVAVDIEQVSLDLGRKILAAHIGLTDNEIPKHLEEVADSIIRATDGNPLALANVSLSLNMGRVNEVEEWKDVSCNLFSLLESEENQPVAFAQTYPRSLGSSMMLSVHSSPERAKKLLFAAAVFDRPSIPLVAVELLLKCSQGAKYVASLMRWRNYLEDRALIRVQLDYVPWSTTVQKTLTIQSLRQRYILLKMESEVNSIVNSLLEDTPSSRGTTEFEFASDKTLATILCAIYGHDKFARRAIDKLQSAYLQKLHKLDCMDRMRSWAAPIVSLLYVFSGEGEENLANLRSHRSARQVFYELAFSGNVENGISNLLALPEAVIPTCWALAQQKVWSTHLQSSHVEGILQGLLSLFHKGSSREVQEVAAKALPEISAAICKKTEVAFPGNMEKLIHLLSTDISDSVRENTIRALGNLVVAERTKAGDFPGLVEVLVESMGSRVNPKLQKEAARALGLLAYDEANRLLIAKYPGVLDQLAGLLRRYVNPAVREEAITSLKRLADSGEPKTRVDGAQEGLMRLLADVNPALQTMARRVLVPDPAVDNTPVTSVESLIISCYDKVRRQRYKEALADVENAERLMMVLSNATTVNEQHVIAGLRQLKFNKTTLTNLNALTLRQLTVFLKAMLKDYHSALSDADRAISLMPTRSFYWQERGVLKRMMGDFPGALADLDTRLVRNPLSYESLKHRAYLKFLMEDITGASADAEEAMKLSSSYQSGNRAQSSTTLPPVVDCLGMLPVQFLDYNLK